MTQTQIIVGLGVIVTLLWGLSLLLLKKQITDVFETVKRLPPQEWFDGINASVRELPGRQWFDEVHKSIKAFPDPERLAQHFERVHKLSNDANVLNLRAEDLKLELREQKDRITRLEERVNIFAGRRSTYINGEKNEK